MGRLRFPVEAGAAIRGTVKRSIMSGAWSHGLEVEVEEDKGFLESVYRFTVTGPDDRVLAFKARLETWMRNLSDDMDA